MPRRSNNPPMTPSEMALEAKAQSESRIYQGRGQTVEANRAVVGSIVYNMADQMEQAADRSRRFDLSDLDAVDRVARQYVRVCASENTLPTVSGAAAAMGRTRDALYKFGRDHEQFQEWLESFSDLCGEAMAQAAVYGSVAAIPSIFVLKSRHFWKDTVSIETVTTNNRYDYDISSEDAERYAKMLED